MHYLFLRTIMPEIPETKEEEDLLNKLKPLNAADGYTEHRVSDALSARHPFLPEQGAKVGWTWTSGFISWSGGRAWKGRGMHLDRTAS